LRSRSTHSTPSLRRAPTPLREATSGFHQTNATREAALERLRALNDPTRRSQAVRAQLGDGDIEGAWRDAEEGGCTADVWRKLGDTRGATHPAEAVPVYRRLLERALMHSDGGACEQAIDLLRALEDALRGPIGKRSSTSSSTASEPSSGAGPSSTG
jgi:hypothetical protein